MKRRLGVWGLFVLAVLLLGVDARAVLAGSTRTVSGGVTQTDALTGHDSTVGVAASQDLDEITVMCRGGRLSIVWYVGNLEPEVAMTGIHIGVYFDGALVGSLIKGGDAGVYNDGPAEIRAAVDCGPGGHTLTARVYSISGTWGVPYANANDLVQRGFMVTEVWPR